MIKKKKKLGFILKILIIMLLIFIFKSVYNYTLEQIYKIDYIEYIQEVSTEYNVDKYLILAMIKAESNFNKEAVSNKNARGLMQLMPATATEVASIIGIEFSEEDLSNPEINIRIGTKYISMLISKYNNLNLAIAAYNAGTGNVDGWIEKGTLKADGSNIEEIPYKETESYVRKIVRDYQIYKELYD